MAVTSTLHHSDDKKVLGVGMLAGVQRCRTFDVATLITFLTWDYVPSGSGSCCLRLVMAITEVFEVLVFPLECLCGPFCTFVSERKTVDVVMQDLVACTRSVLPLSVGLDDGVGASGRVLQLSDAVLFLGAKSKSKKM